MTKFENMKFFINNDKELSKNIQERLFELGYVSEGSKESKFYDFKIFYLYTHKEGVISYSSRSDCREDYPLKTLEDIMSEPNEYKYTFIEALELAEKGKMFVGEDMEEGAVLWFDNDKDKLFIEDYEQATISPLPVSYKFVNQKFKEYKKEPKMVTWYRPINVWHEDYEFPQLSKINMFYRSKEKFDTMKVLEWEVKQFPETYGECE